jgi:hypothetical protein
MQSFLRFKQFAIFVFSVCLSLSIVSPLFAQGTNASLSGNVSDSSGATVSGVTVTVKNSGTGQVRTVQTDTAGRYDVQNLIPGEYEVSAEAPGFSKKRLTGIKLSVSEQSSMNIELSVGQLSETVSVEATATLTQTESSENGTVIDNKKVVELPLANRQFYSLALLSPGAYPPAQTSTLGFRGGFNVAGATEETNLFTYNGTYDSSIGTQQPSYRPSIETIQEFKLLTGVYGAEYGRYSGAQVVVLEKQGSNTFHGSVYEFIRNQASDAKPYFTAATSPNPAFRQNTFGFTFGGPIFKDKTFFFGGYEGQRVNTQNTSLSTIPSVAMLAGIFPAPPAGTFALPRLYNPYTGAELTIHSDGNYHLSDIPQYASSAAAQLGKAFAAYYPSSNSNAPGLAPTAVTAYPSSNYTFSSVQVEKMNEFTIRIDHTVSAKDSISGSYNSFKDPTEEPANILCGSATIPNGGCHFNQIVNLIHLGEVHILSPTLINTFTFGYNRFQMPRTPEDSSLVNPPVLPGAFINPTPVNTGLPNLAVSGYSTLGGPTNIPQNQWLNQYEVVDAINWTRGAHSFKFGFNGFWAITTELFIQNGRGAATFNSASLKSLDAKIAPNNCPTITAANIAQFAPGTTTCYGTTDNSLSDLLLGIPYTTTRNPVAPNVHEGFYSYYGYVGDDWKATKYLTINLGIRYEFNSPAYDSKNVISRFNASTGQIENGYGIPGGTFRYLYNFDWNNFAPRVGFAWQPFKQDKTVVKGAYGVFYNAPIMFNQYISASTQPPVRAPQTYTAVVATPGSLSIALNNPFPTNLPGPFTLFGAEPKQPTPYIHEWSIGIQQALTKSLVLEAVYMGSHGSRLSNTRNINTVPIGIPGIQANRPFPAYGNITYALNSDSSSFNSLQTKLQQTYHNGISYLMAYTYGRSIDQNGGTGSSSNSSGVFQDPRNPSADRGLSDFNVKHRLVFSPVLELPFGRGKSYLNSGLPAAIFGGFQLSGIFQFQTGRPFTITDSASNTSGTFAAGDRPNLVSGQDPNAGPKTVKQWFNTAAFVLQPAGQFGHAPRNNVIGPSTIQVDTTIAREFPIYERVHGQLRVEAFNVLNHPNFFNPYGAAAQFGTSSFGQITNAYNPRELQAALRFTF